MGVIPLTVIIDRLLFGTGHLTTIKQSQGPISKERKKLDGGLTVLSKMTFPL